MNELVLINLTHSDTGIYTSHPDFGGRASFGANFADNSNTDGNGHGTHVAGTTGSNTYGVAKKTNLIAVKVLGSDGSGTNSGVISGINWAANDVRSKGRSGKAVANMSLGGSFSQATNNAVAAATSAGLFMAVAAGNDGADASGSSPASEPSACTVGAIDNTKTEASFSNYGSIVDIFAPGVNVLSTWNDGRTNTVSVKLKHYKAFPMHTCLQVGYRSAAPPWPLHTSLVWAPTCWLLKARVRLRPFALASRKSQRLGSGGCVGVERQTKLPTMATGSEHVN